MVSKKTPTHCVQGGKWLGHRADQSPPMQLYFCSTTYNHGVHMGITFNYNCQLTMLKAVSCNVFFTISLAPKHTHNEQLYTLIYVRTIWVIYALPTSNNYCHVTFTYKTRGKVKTRWSYSCPCAHHKGVWKNGWTAPLTSELNRGEQSASRPNRFTIGERTPVFNVQDAGWAPPPVCTLWKREKSFAPHQESDDSLADTSFLDVARAE